MLKIGRYTAALILIVVGALLLMDQSMDTQIMIHLFDWWPVILITLGVEYLLFNYMNRTGERKMKLDIGGLLIAVIISVIVIGVTHGNVITAKWFGNMDFNPFTLSDENGIEFEKEKILIPIEDNMDQIQLKNQNGNIFVKSGDVEQIEIETTVYVSKLDQTEAQEIADGSTVGITSGSTLEIEAKGKEFKNLGLQYKPKMNLDITLPKDSIKLVISTQNGKVTVNDLNGNIIAESKNGSVKAENISGDIQLETVNGKLSAKKIDGDAELETTSGSVDVENIKGNLIANSTAGNIEILQVTGGIHSNTTAGSIEITSELVGGDWKLATTAGSIKVFVPEDENFRVEGSTSLGSVSSDFPMTETKKKLEGTVGTGEFSIEMETTAGSIELRKLN